MLCVKSITTPYICELRTWGVIDMRHAAVITVACFLCSVFYLLLLLYLHFRCESHKSSTHYICCCAPTQQRSNVFIFYCTVSHEDAYDNSMEMYYLRGKSYKASALHANRFSYENGYLKNTHYTYTHTHTCNLSTLSCAILRHAYNNTHMSALATIRSKML